MADRSRPSDIDRICETIISLQKSLECTICLEIITEPTKTRCGHSFCKSCIGRVLQIKGASCPLCKKSLNRRNISKDDDLQIYIEKFKSLVTAIQIDTNIDSIYLLSHSKKPRDTKESCSYPDSRQSNQGSNKEKRSENERSSRQSNKNANRQTDKPSTSRGTMIDSNNPRYDLSVSNKKPETLSNLYHACAFGNDGTHITPDIKIRTWLHQIPDKLSIDDSIAENEPPIKDETRSTSPISDDNGKSGEIVGVYRDGIDASRQPSQGIKRSTNCPERIDKNNTVSQVNKGASQSNEVIDLNSASGLKYDPINTRIRAKKNREENAKSNIESVNQDSSSSMTAHDKVHPIATPSNTTSTSAITEQSTANWSRMIEFGKEMKRARKRKVKKLNVSTEKNKNPPRIVKDVMLSPNSRYNSAKFAADRNKSVKEEDVSNRLESSSRKQDAIDKSLNSSDAKVKALNEMNIRTESIDKNKTDCSKSTCSTMNVSFVMLEEGRQIRIINLNSNQVNEIVGFENAAEDPHNRGREENAADYGNSSLSQQKRLTVLTPDKLNESIHEHEIIRNVSQTSANNFGSSSCLAAEKQTPRPRETSNVQGTSSGTASSPLLQSSSKARLSLKKRKGIGDSKDVDSPKLSELPLSYRLSIGKHEEYIGDRKSVDSPIPRADELDRFKVVKRQLDFKICEDQQQTDRDTIPTGILENMIEVEDNGGNVSRIVRQDRKLSHNFTGESVASTRSKNIENQGDRSLIKFTQLGSLIRRRNVRYFYLSMTKRELSIPAEVRVTPVYNMQQSNSEDENVATSNLWNDSQNSNNVTVVENICFTNNSNVNEVSKEFPTSSICTSSTPKKDIESHLNQMKNTVITRFPTNANQQSNKSIEDAAEKNVRSFHRTPSSNKSAIRRTISHIYPGTSKSIKLLSPNKDSQLKFLEIDSPTSEREQLRRASSIKPVIKGNNFSEMKSSRLATSTLGEAQEPFIENSYKKRKRTRCATDRELFEDGSNDGNDNSSDLASDSSRSTIKFDRYSKLSKKTSSSRLDENKKRRLTTTSSSDDQDVEVILSFSKKQDIPERKFKISNSDTESESTTHVTKNLKRHNDGQCSQRNASITESATKKSPTKQDSEDLRMRNIIDKWSNEYNTMQKKLTKESKNSQNSVKSMRSSPEENPASHQSSRSSNALKMEKHKDSNPSQKSSTKEPDMFESSSFFNSENMDQILQQSIKNGTSKKITDSFNDDIINRVLQIDRSRSNTDACKPPDSAPRKDTTSQKEKDSREYLLQDNFDEIIANVEQPQSEDFIPCTEQPNRNPNRPLAKQKTSNCPAMTDESCDVMRETPIIPPSSTNDMFEHYSPRNTKKPPTTNASKFQDLYTEWIKNSGKENVACNQKKHGYAGNQEDRKDATINADAINKDSKTIASKHNISREKEKFLEEHNISTDRLHVDNDEMHNVTATGDESTSKDNTFDDSLMNITQHQARLQMFEQDLFGIAPRNQTETTKMVSQEDSPQREQHTPSKRKQNSQAKSTEPQKRFADEDDVVENTPEKKMKNKENNFTTIESRESTNIEFLTPSLKTVERTPNIPWQIVQPFSIVGTSTPTNLCGMYPLSQSTPISEAGNRIKRVKSGILLAKQRDVKMLTENVRQQPDKRNLRFVCSGLLAGQIATVKKFAEKYDADYVSQFDHNVTHVIVKTTGEQNAAKSTLKYLQGIAHRKWIVSYRWIEDCDKQQKLLNEVPYEATTQNDAVTIGAGPRNSRLRNKDLFEGFTFLCIGPYDDVSLDQYQDLLRATGAKVVDSFEALAKMEGMKGVVIQDNAHDGKTIEHWYRMAKVAPILVDWIVECIGHYKLFKLPLYIPCLSPQDFCDIGYPRELVEDEGYSDNE